MSGTDLSGNTLLFVANTVNAKQQETNSTTAEVLV